MNREIKFRVWVSPNCVGKSNMIYDIKPYNCICNSLSEESLTWMQFTGLKDKNGKEIYEGDIVQIQFQLVGSGVTPIITQVIFEKGRFLFHTNKCPYDSSNLSDLDMKWYVETSMVLGNIYENPELLSSSITNSPE